MKLTLEQLEAIAPQSSDRLRLKFLSPLNAAMAEFNINTPKRIAAFLSQVLHESGNFRYVEEIASGKAYEYRKDLGNLHPKALEAAHKKGTTTGRFYKGRGLIQITGFYNYQQCGSALGLDLINDPVQLTDPLLACRSAAWFWATNGLNELADTGDFKRITRIINGGYNGLADREQHFFICRQVLGLPTLTETA